VAEGDLLQLLLVILRTPLEGGLQGDEVMQELLHDPRISQLALDPVKLPVPGDMLLVDPGAVAVEGDLLCELGVGKSVGLRE
jgi:hypothetical protein